ncbi:hypothetical protein [Paraferrimonas sedimenticola]|uniref:Uncharacterized protein n=1 Tax=Paraferrimonas sedimenticola TaxID=375674 RepID=A0AA37RJT5_9GAMM|nr:hypothetical protein [Paraferrimonas sedimenticola]GLP94700.1 hypothetical protein GCM10007895_00060 [Paraferrimonas sedimenticola]
MSNQTSDLRVEYERYLQVPHQYQEAPSKFYTGKVREAATLKLLARFHITSPTVISWYFDISRNLALIHLSVLVKKGLLVKVPTLRSPDGRVYILSYSGAQQAEHLTQLPVYYRSAPQPQKLINLNAVTHDLICSVVCLMGTREARTDAKWDGLIAEREVNRLFKGTGLRVVDALVQEEDKQIAAIEMEHSFKSKQVRQGILVKYLAALEQGAYDKVFLVSQSKGILDDARRLNDQLIAEMLARPANARHGVSITEEQAQLLQKALVYRSAFCEEIESLFYR